mmetsp:Transcript_37311/g.90592  ORF Transcript_37311/g.90592 Transcript_37311/m.90592 type:complete len:98 (-) Transcript_37311:117-410(-)
MRQNCLIDIHTSLQCWSAHSLVLFVFLQTKMTKYEDYDWDELPADIQEAAKLLGYNKELWDNDDEPDECDEWWKDLSAAQQEAATKLGYTEDAWNSS